MLGGRQLFSNGEDPLVVLKGGNDLIVAGYASVEVVDKQGDVITKEALKDAFNKFMQNPSYRNVQLAHSNIQVGDVVPNYTDSEGRLWKSEVDDVGMFVVVQLRNDIEKAKEVSAEIRKGVLRGFSIGGQAFKRVRKSDPKRGDYQEISKLELHEITICEKGINPEATFSILKEDTEVTEMTETENDNEMMKQLGDVLYRTSPSCFIISLSFSVSVISVTSVSSFSMLNVASGLMPFSQIVISCSSSLLISW